jgi:hypothetical protein
VDFQSAYRLRPNSRAIKLSTASRQQIESSQSIDSKPSTTDRRLAGQATAERIGLSVRDHRVVTRRKSWNIAFDGTIEVVANGSELRGEIDVPDRRNLHLLMVLLRVAAFVPIAIAVALAVRSPEGGGVPVVSVAFAAAITVASLLGTVLLERGGLKSAADDAEALTRFLRRLLEPV